MVRLSEHIASFEKSSLAEYTDKMPWELTLAAKEIVLALLGRLSSEYTIKGEIAVHASATIEDGATVRGPAIIGPNSFIAAGSYLRDGCWLEGNCTLGPGVQLKSTFIFAGTKLAHFNYVGDSVVGRGVSFEPGATITNYRSEVAEAEISCIHRGHHVVTGATMFGALVGDDVCIGANAVIAPGAILKRRTVVKRLALVDQCSVGVPAWRNKA